MKHLKIVTVAFGLILSTNIFAQGGNTSSDTGTATASVIASLSLTKNYDLSFGEGIQGDASYTPSAPGRASFTATGEPNRYIDITLPADGTVIMTTGAGGTNETIAVDSFATSSYSLQLNTGGGASWQVGATRPALGASEVPGSYAATLTLESAIESAMHARLCV